MKIYYIFHNTNTKILYLLLLFLPFKLFSQKTTKSEKPYKAFNSTIYNIGDTIRIGTPKDFSNTFSYFYRGRDLNKKVDAVSKFTISGEERTFDYRLQKHTIKYFHIVENGATYAVIDKLFGLMIDIDNGIKSGELVTTDYEELFRDKTTILTDSLAYLEYLKFTKDYSNENTKEFLYLFDNKKYNIIREDEFEFNKELNKTKAILKEASLNRDDSKVYRITFDDVIGNYDFDKKGFPILWENNGVHLLSDLWTNYTPQDINKNKVSLTDLRLKFSNTEKYNIMPLDEERANYFVKFRKGNGGDINRSIKMVIYFTINSLVKSETKGWKDFTFNGENNFGCSIKKIYFFEEGWPGKNYLSILK